MGLMGGKCSSTELTSSADFGNSYEASLHLPGRACPSPPSLDTLTVKFQLSPA